MGWRRQRGQEGAGRPVKPKVRSLSVDERVNYLKAMIRAIERSPVLTALSFDVRIRSSQARAMISAQPKPGWRKENGKHGRDEWKPKRRSVNSASARKPTTSTTSFPEHCTRTSGSSDVSPDRKCGKAWRSARRVIRPFTI